MRTQNLFVALTAAALFTAASAFAQTPAKKQPSQEGGLSVPAAPPTGKQPAQEGGLSVPAVSPSPSGKQPAQEGGLSVPAAPTPGVGSHRQD
jgi:hypothetical protein